MPATYIKNPTSIGEMVEYLKTNYDLRGGYKDEKAKTYLAEKVAKDISEYVKEYLELEQSLQKIIDDSNAIKLRQKAALKNYNKRKNAYLLELRKSVLFKNEESLKKVKEEFDWSVDTLTFANNDVAQNDSLKTEFETNLNTVKTKMDQITDVYSIVEPNINWRSITEEYIEKNRTE